MGRVKWFFTALIRGPRVPQLLLPGQERYATRSLETYLAFVDILFGMIILMPFWNTLEATVYARLLQVIPIEEFWGGVLVVRGVLHAIALRINGRAWWTPFARAIASGISAMFWAGLFVSLLLVDSFRPGLVFTIAAANVWAHIYCVRRSGRDARLALETR